MNATLGISVILLSAWVLPEVGGSGISTTGPRLDLPMAPTNPSASAPLGQPPALPPSSGQSAGGYGGGYGAAAPGYSAGYPGGAMGGYGGYGGMGGMRPMMPSPTQAARQFIPAVPTDPNAELPDIRAAAPTAAARRGASRATGAVGYGASRYVPRSPAARLSAGLSPTAEASRGRYNANRAPLNPYGEGGPERGSTRGGTAAVNQKPFSGYRPPPAISPYINLFRRDAGDDFDNYNTLVKPFIEQRQFNNRMRQEVQGLDEMSQQQQRALRQMNQRNQVFQGTTDPRYFQDTGNFYQGGR